MDFLKRRVRRVSELLSQLIERLPDDDLEDVWVVLEPLYYDLYMLKAIRESQRTVRPGDTMKYEEAIRVLHLP